MFGLSVIIDDRTDGRGESSSDPITTSNRPHVLTSTASCPLPSHYSASAMTQDGDARGVPYGFCVYSGQGTVYDDYWRESATWISARPGPLPMAK